MTRIEVCNDAPESMVKPSSSGSGPSNVMVAFNSDPASMNAESVARSLRGVCNRLKKGNLFVSCFDWSLKTTNLSQIHANHVLDF